MKGFVETEVLRSDFILSDQIVVKEYVIRDLISASADTQVVLDIVFVNVIEIVGLIGRNCLNLENVSFELEDRLNVEVIIQEVSYHGMSLVKDELILESDNFEVFSIVLVELFKDYFPELIREVVVNFNRVASRSLVNDQRYLTNELVLLFILLEFDDVFLLVLVLPLAKRG